MTSAVGDPPRRLPTHVVETLIRSLWGEFFGRPVGPDDDFFDLGGDSLAVLEIVLEARKRGLELRSSQALRHSTPARLAEAVTLRSVDQAPERLLDLVTAAAHGTWQQDASAGPGGGTTPTSAGDEGSASPLFVVHSDSHRAAEQAALLGWGLGRRIHGLRLPGLDGSVTDSPAIVSRSSGVAESVRTEQPDGPVFIAGFGLGAVFAFEAARALRAAGRQVGLLALVSPALPGAAVPHRTALLSERVAVLGARFGLGNRAGGRELLIQAHAAGWFEDVRSSKELVGLQAAWAELTSAVAGHKLDDFDGSALLAVDTAHRAAAEQVWGPVLATVGVCRLDHGLTSPAGALRDPRLAEALRKVCA